MKKRFKNLMFVQTCGTYTDEILVIVGEFKKTEVFKYLKKVKAKVDYSKWVLNDYDEWLRVIKEEAKGLFCFNDKVSGTVLMLRKPEDTWEYWEVIMHEVHHIVQKLSKKNKMFEEAEAQAYLFEYLFRQLRRKIMGIEKT